MRGVLLVAFLAGAAACGPVGQLTARVSDEWTRAYPLEAPGEVQITNTNGAIDVEGVDGSEVQVRAERVARGATEALAREILPRITIKEDIRPDRVAIETERLAGVMIGASFSIDYHVRVPKAATVRMRTTTGTLEIDDVDGRVVVTGVNGTIKGRGLGGGVEARTVNGSVEVSVAAVGDDPIDLKTTNGPIRLVLPKSAKA